MKIKFLICILIIFTNKIHPIPDYYVYGVDIQKRENVKLSEAKISEIDYLLSPEQIRIEDSEYLIKLFLIENVKTYPSIHRQFFWIPAQLVLDEHENVRDEFYITLMQTSRTAYSLPIEGKKRLHFKVLRSRL